MKKTYQVCKVNILGTNVEDIEVFEHTKFEKAEKDFEEFLKDENTVLLGLYEIEKGKKSFVREYQNLKIKHKVPHAINEWNFLWDCMRLFRG